MLRLPDLISGPPPALPDALDRVAERWAATPPRLRWAAVGALAVLVLAVMGRGAVASPWGAPTVVVVATRDIPPGTALSSDDIALASWPESLAADAVRTVEKLAGAVATQHLTRDAPIPVGAVGDGGLAAVVGPGRAAVAVTDPGAPPATVGWSVDVVAQGYDGEAVVLATSARVLAAHGSTVWLDVDRAEAPGVAAASARGDVSLVLLPPGSG